MKVIFRQSNAASDQVYGYGSNPNQIHVFLQLPKKTGAKLYFVAFRMVQCNVEERSENIELRCTLSDADKSYINKLGFYTYRALNRVSNFV